MRGGSVAALLLIVLLALLGSGPARSQEPTEPVATETVWYAPDEDGSPRVRLYLFWSLGCPHCAKEHAFLDGLRGELPWLDVVEYELSEHREHVSLLLDMAEAAGGSTSVVPTTFICNQMTVGYQDDATTGESLRRQVLACRDQALHETIAATGTVLPEAAHRNRVIEPIALPIVGVVDPGQLSLPVLTITMAAVDSFNPCGLFVLLMLMSMMIRAKSRVHMLVVGASFAVTWALMYLALMTAWLSLFEYVGDLSLITTTAGVIALVMAALNIKDFLGFSHGPSLSIRPEAKAGLFHRMGSLARSATLSIPETGKRQIAYRCGVVCKARRFSPMVLGTAALTLSAGGYAILCTSGFAMTYTRILTLDDISFSGYLLYLWLYISVYMIPMTLIVVAFTATLGSRKLKEEEGRALKLLGGSTLLAMGTILILVPDWLKNPLIVVAIMLFALAVTVVVVTAERTIRSHGHRRRRLPRTSPQANLPNAG